MLLFFVNRELHEKVANQRKIFLNHESKKLATNFDIVAIGDLNMKEMSLNAFFPQKHVAVVEP